MNSIDKLPDEPLSPAFGQEFPPVAAIYQGGRFVLPAPLALPEGAPMLLQLAPAAVEAVYAAGAIRPLAPLDLPEGTAVNLQLAVRLSVVVTPGGAGLPAEAEGLPAAAPLAAPLPAPLARGGLLAQLTRRDWQLLGLVMLVYALVRLVGLADFPIYYFSDEAIHTNQGVALIQNGFFDQQGVFLPPYFRNVEKWNLSLSVYLQGASGFLLGKSVLVSRATSVAVTLLAGVAVALALRLVFQLRLWWAGPLVLSALPVWFLHSRTAFETVLAVSFYACFLCAYLIYRCVDRRAVIAAILFGAATFYSYTNGQGLMLASAGLLLLSDLRYHGQTLRQFPRLRWAALLTLVLAALPYVRFRWLYPDAIGEHLFVMDSIWMRDVPLVEKLGAFVKNYALGLSPAYWFAPNNGIDLSRHSFKDWGNFPLVFLPLVLIGLWVCMRSQRPGGAASASTQAGRASAHRLVLAAVLAAPFSASLVQIHNYRVLAMVVPAALLATLGLDRLAGWLIERRVPAPLLAAGSAAGLVGLNVTLLLLALTRGPTWYDNYGMYGMQYGARQLFPAIAEMLHTSPGATMVVSPDWANNADEFARFFLPPALQARLRFLPINDFLARKHDLHPQAIYVLPAADVVRLRGSGKFELGPPLRVLPYPDGRPGFYFLRLRYVDYIDQLFAAERAARQQLVEGQVTLDGQVVRVRHSLTDLGSLDDLFDDDHRTLLRGFEANPFVLEFEFPEPRPIGEIGLDFWRDDLGLTVTVFPDGDGPPLTYTAEYRNPPLDPHIDFPLPGGPLRARKLRLELLVLNGQDLAKLHIPGLWLRQSATAR